LAACQTARGDKRATLGLAGVAINAGARSTLATLWKVIADESPGELLSQFYRQLKENPNITKAEALRRAQLEFLKDDSRNRPYFWAPYVLVGNWL
jgi:CHAT domain-containing protein